LYFLLFSLSHIRDSGILLSSFLPLLLSSLFLSCFQDICKNYAVGVAMPVYIQLQNCYCFSWNLIMGNFMKGPNFN
jgi:hypothetical protein